MNGALNEDNDTRLDHTLKRLGSCNTIYAYTACSIARRLVSRETVRREVDTGYPTILILWPYSRAASALVKKDLLAIPSYHV